MFYVVRFSLLIVFISFVLSYLHINRFKSCNSASTMGNYGLLLVSNISKIQNFLSRAPQHVNKVLYIKVSNIDHGAISHQISNIYSKAISTNSNLDVRLILKPLDVTKRIPTKHPIDIILHDETLTVDSEFLKGAVTLENNFTMQNIDIPDSTNNISETVKCYDYTALGGTFDRLHNGHKILLSHAALRTNKKLTVGVTDVNMIRSKKLWELIEPVEKRIQSVQEFLNDINPDIEYNVVPIQDMYGPAKDDPSLQLIVVSEETSKGGDKVNEKRKERGLSLLEKYVITLAQDKTQYSEEEPKVSSGNLRMRLLGTQLRPPTPNSNIPDWPYVIGLAGGIASGKSNITKYLQAKGAAIVNCDIIAHDLYKPGLPLNMTIADNFGKDLITNTGEVDRKKLGAIVFKDKNQLNKLNTLVWPAVLEEAKQRVAQFGKQGKRVVVMEAAVMIRAGWYNSCHQLWAVIVPPEEAIRRIQERNSLTEEEARQRVESQPTNEEQIALANVVFSPYWSYEYTKGQVEKAWNNLQEYLKSR